MTNVNLKIRTEYSLGRVFAHIGELIEQLKETGVSAAGMVDSSTWGHVKFYNACKAAGIQPLLGATSIVSEENDNTPLMWFLARNTQGLSELYRALSLSYHQCIATTKGPKPRLRHIDVLTMSDDILIFCGGVSDKSFLSALAKKHPSTFFFDIVENGSALNNAFKESLACDLGVRMVGVRDNTYLKESDAEVPSYLKFGRTSLKDQSLKQPALYQDTAKDIAAMCEGLALPVAPMIRVDGDLEQACRAAIPERFPNQWDEEHERRLQHELEEIRGKDFDSYFLLVQDMARYAKKHMLVGPSRGSAAGSLVCYLLHITEIDPLPPRLYFERFIDKSRKDLPDIDLDFPDDKRGLVIEYLKEKYGADCVAHVGNISCYKPFSALMQVSKKLGIESGALAQTKAAMITRSKSDPRFLKCLEDTLNQTIEGQSLLERFPAIAVAGRLEGHASHSGVHAAGVLVCNEPISNFCVVDGAGVAHIDKHDLEQLNLLKMDVLGLRTLTVLEDIPVKDWYNLPTTDAQAFDVFNNRRFCGVFQFEGAAMRKLASRVHFNSLDEIDAVTALARPGPMAAGLDSMWLERHSGAPYQSLSPLLAKILARTYELPLYQEDTMAIVRELGDFSWEQTSKVRKAVSKSQGAAALAPYKDPFITHAMEKGLSLDIAEKIWAGIVGMGAWQMNKAHTYSYANISYWVAYAKAHYPLEFAAATLNHAKDDESAVALLKELQSEGLQYVYFDPDKSKEGWSVQNGVLFGGFLALDGVGPTSAKKYIKMREQGQFTQKVKSELLSLPCIFKDLYPLATKYRSYYDGLENVRGDVLPLSRVVATGRTISVVFIARLVSKDCRTVDRSQLHKRGYSTLGERYYVLRFVDDTGEIWGKVPPYEKELVAALATGFRVNDVVLVRATLYAGIRFAFVTKLKGLH